MSFGGGGFGGFGGGMPMMGGGMPMMGGPVYAPTTMPGISAALPTVGTLGVPIVPTIVTYRWFAGPWPDQIHLWDGARCVGTWHYDRKAYHKYDGAKHAPFPSEIPAGAPAVPADPRPVKVETEPPPKLVTEPVPIAEPDKVVDPFAGENKAIKVSPAVDVPKAPEAARTPTTFDPLPPPLPVPYIPLWAWPFIVIGVLVLAGWLLYLCYRIVRGVLQVLRIVAEIPAKIDSIDKNVKALDQRVTVLEGKVK